MSINGVYANVACCDLRQSRDWYTTLFGREPDALPMDGLVEWHWGDHGFQLHENEAKAGSGTVTLRADGLTAEWERLTPLDPGPVETATHLSILQLHDPDGNVVVLAGEA